MERSRTSPRPDRSDREKLREVRLAVAGWATGIPFGVGIGTLVAGGNPYVVLASFMGAFVLWETLRRAAGWLR